MSKAGLVYILKNECMPGIVKVGRTGRNVIERANELFTTGVPVPFEVVFAIFADDAAEVEQEIHERLRLFRIIENREFFRIDETECTTLLLNAILEHSNEYIRAVHVEAAIEEPDWSMYADMAGVHPYSVTKVIACLSEEEWRAAAVRYEQKCQARVREYRLTTQVIGVSENGVSLDQT